MIKLLHFYLSEILYALQLELPARALLLQIHVSPLSHVQPEEFNYRSLLKYSSFLFFFAVLRYKLPVEKWLPTIAVKPMGEIELEIVSVPMTMVNLKSWIIPQALETEIKCLRTANFLLNLTYRLEPVLQS